MSSHRISGTIAKRNSIVIERIVKRKNVLKAMRQVVRNGGSPGIDGMEVKELPVYFNKAGGELTNSICNRKYFPSPILGITIPKDNGKERLLGVPTVIDRMLQQSVSQILSTKFEPEFRDHSYGFRPNRNAQQAVQASQKHINEGYKYIVDIDLQNFFDEVDHCILLQLIYNKVKCDTTLRLIRKWLRAPIQRDGKLHRRRKGVPQGSPLSPLLSNILLNELDSKLEKEDLRYVRYADDFSIYLKSRPHAREIGNKIFLFLKNGLKLPINWEKSGIRKPSDFNILGYRFTANLQQGTTGYIVTPSPKSWDNLKRSLKQLTKKTTSYSFDVRIKKLKEVHRGWINYFRLASMQEKLKALDRWIRNRLRYCIWNDWKKPRRRMRNLIRLGVQPKLGYLWSKTKMGGWSVAQSPIMGTSVTLEKLRKRGYESMLDHYEKSLYYLMNRCIRDPYVQWCERLPRCNNLATGRILDCRQTIQDSLRLTK
jgi:RNA-directed DNA polymerase